MKIPWFLLGLLISLSATRGASATPRFVVQSGHPTEVRQALVSPGGSYLASLSDDSLRVWERSGVLRWSVPLSGSPRALAWSPDGQKIAVGFGGSTGFFTSKPGETAGVVELSGTDGTPIRRLPFGNNFVSEVSYLPGDALRARSGDGVATWDAGSTRTVTREVNDFLPSPDGKWRLRLREDVQIVEAQSGKVVAHSPRLKSNTPALRWSPDSKQLASFDGADLWVWASNRARTIPVYRTVQPDNPSFPPDVQIAIAPDGGSAVCTRTDYPKPRQTEGQSDDQGAPRGFLWRVNLQSGAVQTLRNAVPRFFGALDFWSDGTLILGGGRERAPGFYQGELFFARLSPLTLSSLWSEPEPLGAAFQLALAPDGKTLAVGGGDTAIRLWNLRTGRLEKSLKELSSDILALDFSPDGKRVAALDYSNFFLFDRTSGRARKFAGLELADELRSSVSFAPDGKQVVFGSDLGGKALDLASGKFAAKAADWYAPLQWTGDGVWKGGGAESDSLQLLNTRTFKSRLGLDGSGVGSESRGRSVAAFSLAPKAGKILTIEAADNRDETSFVRRWNVVGNAIERTLSEFPGATRVASSPDETRFVAGNGAGEVAVFDFNTLALRWKFESGARVNDLKWSRDGNAIFAAGDDGFTRVFSPAGDLRATLCALPSRTASFTGYEWLRFSPDGTFAASPAASRQVRVFEDENGDEKARSLNQLSAQKQPDIALWSGPNFALASFALPQLAATPRPSTRAKTAGPTLVLQGDKIYQFGDLATSRGGKWLASSQGEAGEIQLWDSKNALQWSQWPSASGEVPLLFTPDATRLLTRVYRGDVESTQRPLALVTVPSGRRMRTFNLPPAPLWCNNFAVRGVKDGQILTFDLRTGRKLSTRKIQGALDKAGRSGPRFAFSRDGRFLVEGSGGTIRWWRTGDGKKLGQIRDPLRAIGKTAISSDGQWLASEGDDPKWSPPQEAASEAAYARTFNLHVWNAATRKLVRTVRGYYSLSGGARLLEFSTDGRTLFGANDDGLDRYLWQTGENSPLPTPRKDGRKGLDWPLALSDDAQFLGSAGQIYQSSDFGPGLQLWNVPLSRPVASFAGTLRGASKLSWSPDGKYLAGGDRLTLWDARTGALLVEDPRVYAYNLRWVDNQTIRSQTLGKSEWFRAPKLEKLREFDVSPPAKSDDPFSGQYSDGISVSPDGTLALTENPTRFGGSEELWVWEIATKKLVRKIATPKQRFGFSEFDRVVWLPDNRRVVFGTQSGMTLLNAVTGEVEKLWRDPTDPTFEGQFSSAALLPLAVSGDGKWLVVGAARDQTALIYDLATGEFVRRLPVKVGYRAQFASDNRTAILATQKGLEWWDVAAESQTATRILSGVPGTEWTLSPDEERVAFGANSVTSNGVSIWNVRQQEEVVRLYLLGGTSQSTTHDWIALTPEGFYHATPRGEKRLRWRDERGFWPLERSRARFQNPEKVAQALQNR